MVIIVKANFRLKQHENCLAFSAGLILILFYILFLFFCSFVRLVKKFSLLQIIKRIQKFCITTVYKACIETSWSREIKFDSLPKAWKVNMNTIFEGTYIHTHTYIHFEEDSVLWNGTKSWTMNEMPHCRRQWEIW